MWLETDEAGKHERYGAAAAQLGHEQATVRLAGVYALANLADQWHTQRQQCVDVLCAYLRIPWQPPMNPDIQPTQTGDASQSPQGEDGTARTDFSFAGESEVRKTITRVIADHLRNPDGPSAPGPGPWSDLTLDFTGAILPESNFERCTFAGAAGWRATHFLQDAGFDRATFTGVASFDGATFEGAASFCWGMFTSAAGFDGATFTGDVSFCWGTFTGVASFDGATFTGDVSFYRATLTAGASFDGATTFSGWVSEDIHRFLSEEQLARIEAATAGEAEGDGPGSIRI